MPVSVDGVIESTEELLDQVKYLAGVVDTFFEVPLPDACEALIYRCDLANQNNAYLSAFERYAARLLRCAQAEDLRRIFSRHEIAIGRLASTGLAWLRFDPDVLTSAEEKVLLGVESALNRLIMLVKAAESVEDIARLSAADAEDACMTGDWALFSRFGTDIEPFSSAMQSENPLQGIFGVSAPKGGEWDTRTRFVRYMESIAAPFRLEYRFDCQVERGLFEIHVSTLTPSVVPPQRRGGTLREWTNASAEGHRLALSYALRLCSFVAGAAFFSNVGITDVVVTAHRRTLRGGAIASLYFERMPFLLNAVPAMKMGDLSGEDALFDPLAAARLLSPTECRFAFDDEGRARYIDPLEIDFDERRLPVWEDERPLPEGLRHPLHADTVRDLDISRIEDQDVAARVREAAIDMDEYPVASLAVFEEVLAQDRLAHSEQMDSGFASGGTRLFCLDEAARVLMGLRDSSDARFAKCPDVVFISNQKASTINQSLGDLDAARLYSQRGLELAPTSTIAYGDLASVELESGRFQEAVRLLQLGLCFAFDPASIEYLYYRLAYALYKTGRIDACLATYLHVIEQSGRFAHQAKSELGQILAKEGLREVPTMETVSSVMESEGIPLAPTSEVRTCIAQAIIGLVEMGAYSFVWPLCASLGQYLDRDIVSTVAASLRSGVQETQ